MMSNNEIWKDIKGYEGYYQISNLGNVRSLDRYVNSAIRNNNKVLRKGTLLKQYTEQYLYVKLSKEYCVHRKNIHRLIAESFIPNPDNLPVVNHKDGNKHNNSIDNLEWVTVKQNTRHAFDNNLVKIKKGGEHHLSKKVIQYDKNNNFIKEWGSIIDVEREIGVNRSAITEICNHKPHHHTAGGFKWEWGNNL